MTKMNVLCYHCIVPNNLILKHFRYTVSIQYDVSFMLIYMFLLLIYKIHKEKHGFFFSTSLKLKPHGRMNVAKSVKTVRNLNIISSNNPRKRTHFHDFGLILMLPVFAK